ncbi:MAG: metal-dependent transcriptional regulator [Deltaproteobacteria bacterium]|nr:metal-dependent transcriptional regulator [Deltaproteobacteria bacterium]
MNDSKITPALEDYIKAIYILAEEDRPVIAARVAEEIGVSPSTMFSALRRLEKEGYVRVGRRKNIHLTTRGKKIAETTLRRHYLTERFLTDLLGLDWVKAHQEAHRLEHAISTEVEEKLAEILHYPTTCPHGNPIPDEKSPHPRRRGLPLDSISAGREVVFQCISEIGERDARLLGFLLEHRLLPGATVQVLDVAPSLGIMSLKVGKKKFSIGIEAAKKIRVI